MLGWALATFVKGMKIRLRKIWLSNLAEREVPQHRNCWWSDEFMINYDGYGFVLCLMCPTSCPSPSPTLSLNMYCHLTTNTQQHHYHYHTTPHQGSNANNTSTIRAKCLAEHCVSPENDSQRVGRGGGVGVGVDYDPFYQTGFFCGKIITIMG